MTKAINFGGQAEGLGGSSSGNSSNSSHSGGRRGSSSTSRGMGSSAGSIWSSSGKGSSSMSWAREGAQAEGSTYILMREEDTDAPAAASRRGQRGRQRGA